MIKILFVCHGNICRSTMSQFVLQDMVHKLGIAEQFCIDSRATSTEEIGNPQRNHEKDAGGGNSDTSAQGYTDYME